MRRGRLERLACGMLAASTISAVEPVVDGNDLFLFEDLPVVVSSSRQETRQHLSLAPVSVIGGAVLDDAAFLNLYEPFDFVPGVDLLQLGRHRYAMGVRGLHDTYSDRTLSLIDGRPADHPGYGGSHLADLPLHQRDVERIEVVRGPGGAVWGANAFAGVVNIITRRPDDPTIHGLYTSGLVSHYGDLDAMARHAGTRGAISWRVSLDGNRIEDSADALDDDELSGKDWQERVGGSGELLWSLAEGTELRIGAGVVSRRTGADDFFQLASDEEVEVLALRSWAGLRHGVAHGEWQVDLTASHHDETHPTLTEYRTEELDSTVWYIHRGWKRHAVSIGVNASYAEVTDEAQKPEDIRFVGDDDETSIGAFVSDRWQLRDDLALEGQFRMDDYSETDLDWSGRLGLVKTLDEEERHVVRFAGARAFRTPYAAWRRIEADRVILFPGVPLFQARPPEDIENETTWSVEAGYTGFLSQQVTLRLDLYYQRYEDLIGIRDEAAVRPIPVPPFALPGVDVVLENIDGADSYGGELQMGWRDELLELEAWYAYNGFETDDQDQALRAYQPAEHKVGGSVSWHLTRAWSLRLLYRYSDETPGDVQGSDVDAYHRVDIYLRYRFADGRGNLVAGVRDLFDEMDYEAGGVGQTDPEAAVGITGVLRCDWSY